MDGLHAVHETPIQRRQPPLPRRRCLGYQTTGIWDDAPPKAGLASSEDDAMTDLVLTATDQQAMRVVPRTAAPCLAVADLSEYHGAAWATGKFKIERRRCFGGCRTDAFSLCLCSIP